MPVASGFNQTTSGKSDTRKRPAPFSIRLSEADRARLAIEAAGAPLGAYIKAKLLDGMPEGRKRRKVLTIKASSRASSVLISCRRAQRI